MMEPDVVDLAAHASARATLDVRTLPGMTSERLLARAREAVGAGRGAPAATFFTDAGVLARPGMDVVICGPGSPDQAHVVDEHCEIARIVAAVDLFERAAMRWAAGATEDGR
jgi:succinyl-diaminopimelate desuccinylase